MKLRLDPKATVERAIGLAVLVLLALGPAIFNDYWVNTILTQMFIFGIAAASLIFLSAYGAHDLARPDRADGHLRLPAREHGHAGRRRRRDQGPDARLGPDRSRSCSRS